MPNEPGSSGGRDLPIEVLEPTACGRWCVTTVNGSRYLFDLPSDGTPRVTRYPGPAARRSLRGDGTPLIVISWESTRAARGGDPCVLLGDQVILVLEPLSADAEFSVCITSRVAQIEDLAGVEGT